LFFVLELETPGGDKEKKKGLNSEFKIIENRKNEFSNLNSDPRFLDFLLEVFLVWYDISNLNSDPLFLDFLLEVFL
jgi:hypothetical protein